MVTKVKSYLPIEGAKFALILLFRILFKTPRKPETLVAKCALYFGSTSSGYLKERVSASTGFLLFQPNSYIRVDGRRTSGENMNFSKVSGKNSQHKVLVYALSTCVWCKMTKQYLKDNDIQYEYVDVDLCDEKDKQKIREHIVSKGGSLSYPTIIVDDNVLITGFRKDKLREVLGI